MSAATRKPYTKACPECHEDFQPWRSTQRFCSKSCAAAQPRPQRRVDKTGPGRDKYGSPGVEIACKICAAPFIVPPGDTLRRKTCSVACAAILKRSSGRNRKGAANPNWRHGGRSEVRERDGERRWREALGARCMAPGCETPFGVIQPLFLHHICYRQHVRKAGGDIWDPRNAFTICNSCHGKHHTRGRMLPLSCLPDPAFEFAAELHGPEYGADYLRRYYLDDGDLRVVWMEGRLAA